MSATTPDHITHHGDNTPGSRKIISCAKIVKAEVRIVLLATVPVEIVRSTVVV